MRKTRNIFHLNISIGSNYKLVCSTHCMAGPNRKMFSARENHYISNIFVFVRAVALELQIIEVVMINFKL